MRTNIELDDDLLKQAQAYSRTRSKRALVREALQTYVAVKADEKRRMTYRDRLAAVRAKAAAAGNTRRGDSRDVLRADRDAR